MPFNYISHALYFLGLHLDDEENSRGAYLRCQSRAKEDTNRDLRRHRMKEAEKEQQQQNFYRNLPYVQYTNRQVNLVQLH